MISPTKCRKEQFFWAASRPRHFYTGSSGYALVKVWGHSSHQHGYIDPRYIRWQKPCPQQPQQLRTFSLVAQSRFHSFTRVGHHDTWAGKVNGMIKLAENQRSEFPSTTQRRHGVDDQRRPSSNTQWQQPASTDGKLSGSRRLKRALDFDGRTQDKEDQQRHGMRKYKFTADGQCGRTEGNSNRKIGFGFGHNPLP